MSLTDNQCFIDYLVKRLKQKRACYIKLKRLDRNVESISKKVLETRLDLNRALSEQRGEL